MDTGNRAYIEETSKVSGKLQIEPISIRTAKAAKAVIVAGLTPYFDHYEPAFNLDLEDPLTTYQTPTTMLLVALWQGEVVGTGGLIEEREGVGRIVRVSVLEKMRRKHIGHQMMGALEKVAVDKGYHTIILETTTTWLKAKQFYLHNGYQVSDEMDGDTYFIKKLIK